MRQGLTVAFAAALLLSGCSAAPRTGATYADATAASQATQVPTHAAPASQTVIPSYDAATPAAKVTDFSILDDLMFETISAEYRAVGVPLDRSDYDRLSDSVCKDMQKRGSGYFTIGDLNRLSESGKEALSRSMWLVLAASCYPDDYLHSDADLDAMVDFLAGLAPEYQRRLTAAGLATSAGGSSLYGGSNPDASYLSSRPSGSGTGGYTGGSSGSGYSTMCNDGTTSHSGGKRGACSWHGGVSK